MDLIVASRPRISDRFPVASFSVKSDPGRFFEITCATDPALFHTDHQDRRNSDNFYTSRGQGLMPLPQGDTSYLLPPDQLQRFAGAKHVYYALATYGSPDGRDARFTIGPNTLDRVPRIALSSDFTGRTLDRRRLRRPRPQDSRYGRAESRGKRLTWGGDLALIAQRRQARPAGSSGKDVLYDDGFDPALWRNPVRMGAASSASPTARPSGAEPAGLEDARSTTPSGGPSYGGAVAEPPGLEDGRQRAAARYGSAVPAEPTGREDGRDTTARYGGGEPPGSEDARHVAARFGGAPGVEPTGWEDGRGSGSRDAVRYGQVSRTSEPTGWEDGRGAHATARYGRGSSEPDGLEDARSIERSADGGRFGGVNAAEPPGLEDATQLGRRVGNSTSGENTPTTTSPLPTTDEQRSADRPADDPALDTDAQPRKAEERRDNQTAVNERGRHPQHAEEELVIELPDVAPDAQGLSLQALDIPAKLRIAEVVAVAESGPLGYAAAVPWRRYDDEGLATTSAPQGLLWGFVLFDQRSGAIGEVLRAAKRRSDQLAADPSFPSERRLHAVLGLDEDDDLDELIEVTTADTPEARLREVDGQPLWASPWLERFAAAGAVDYIQAAQREVAITRHLDPNLAFARDLGLMTDRALAFVFDRCIDMGNGGGPAWIARHAGPIRNRAQRDAALQALGHASLRDFQQSAGVPATGKWSARTHAALAARLRTISTRSPVVAPDVDEMLARLVAASVGDRRVMARLHRLLVSDALHDVAFDLR